jgi:hypothetical protein
VGLCLWRVYLVFVLDALVDAEEARRGLLVICQRLAHRRIGGRRLDWHEGVAVRVVLPAEADEVLYIADRRTHRSAARGHAIQTTWHCRADHRSRVESVL